MQPNPRSLAVKSYPHGDPPRAEEELRDPATGEMIDFEAVREGRQRDNYEIETKISIWVRIMDAIMGWLFVTGLFLWAYVLRGRAADSGKQENGNDDRSQTTQ